MSCEICKGILQIDEVEPPCFCEVEEGEIVPGVNACWIPELDEKSKRILVIRQKITALKELVDSGTILRLYEADLEDIELLAYLEDELRQMQDEAPKPKEG
ncbi:MAG: hypothetical protein Q7U10_08815 [Thermodesulfovibrionia bacterium]|nr:hypothetical protein [Thermodesulfovibrionia bacterium]